MRMAAFSAASQADVDRRLIALRHELRDVRAAHQKVDPDPEADKELADQHCRRVGGDRTQSAARGDHQHVE
jgi:hypothetical protein